ncbi:MAG TPA: hypothetical protein VEK39_06365 [Solirubrobacterales bacterium]|nr:hypothetical protein [Solirubrobacterales bacterium]
MGRLTPVDLKPWMLPLLAVAISVPIVVAFALAGPGAGTAAGALVAAAIVVIAARSRFDEEIEVAAAPPGESGVLVVATAPIEGAAAVEAVASARSREGGDEASVLVVAPALNTTVSHWLSDLRRARLEAQERLAVSLAVLTTAGIEARGSVGDTDPLQATEDALRSFAAGEVVFVTRPGSDERVVREVRRRLDRRVAQVDGAEPAARRASAQPAGS